MQLLVPWNSEITSAGIGGSLAGRGATQVETGFPGLEEHSTKVEFDIIQLNVGQSEAGGYYS